MLGEYFLLFSLAFLIASLPMIGYAKSNWDNFVSRSRFLYEMNYKNQRSKTNLLTNIKTSLLLFNHKANGNDFFINEPLVDKPVSWFIPLGLVVCLFRVITRRSKNYLFILSWFA